MGAVSLNTTLPSYHTTTLAGSRIFTKNRWSRTPLCSVCGNTFFERTIALVRMLIVLNRSSQRTVMPHGFSIVLAPFEHREVVRAKESHTVEALVPSAALTEFAVASSVLSPVVMVL